MRNLCLIVTGTLICMVATTGVAVAQKWVEAPRTHCDPNYTTDIGPTILAQPDGTIQTVSGDCTLISGCDDYFDITCSAGDTLFMTFCSGGGTAGFDTGLSTWSGAGFPTMEACNDDTCGLQSELTFVFPATDTFRARIGGFAGANGPYTLAYSAPAGCIITGAPVPTMSQVGLLVLTLLLALGGLTALFRRRYA